MENLRSLSVFSYNVAQPESLTLLQRWYASHWTEHAHSIQPGTMTLIVRETGRQVSWASFCRAYGT